MGVNKMLKKDGMIRKIDSVVYENYQKLRAHKKVMQQKAQKIQEDLCSGEFYIVDDEEKKEKE